MITNDGLNSFRDAAGGHAMLPELSHDELAEQMYVRDLKMFLGGELEATHQRAAFAIRDAAAARGQNDTYAAVRDALFDRSGFQTWVSLRREAQHHMWQSVGQTADRQRQRLNALAAIPDPQGSVTVDPAFEAPAYLANEDVHLMPGGYTGDRGEDGVLQGAVIDLGGAVFMRGLNGGLLNDRRGQTAMSHILACYPDLEVRRILELGCGIGASTVPAAWAFPEAEVHGIDVGASMLRYAHARAEHLGARVHFSQQNAERTRFPDGHFDLVYSCVTLHETSQEAVVNILAESRRLLRPGGVAVHLEVPLLYGEDDLWSAMQAELEADYNNEPNWQGALTADYAALMRAAGFETPLIGYQDAVADARKDTRPGVSSFSTTSKGPFRSWFIASGRA
ncbi:class I SAM-dependent methyltransferase [Polymorphobacter sp.]|uniref:class I SAM-dependent methyltransferase n=1 Tax=Polymorphobacter sp. TaxID=1909290 RepID=UPI003F6F1A5F